MIGQEELEEAGHRNERVLIGYIRKKDEHLETVWTNNNLLPISLPQYDREFAVFPVRPQL